MSFRWFGSAVEKAELIATVQLRLRPSVPAALFARNQHRRPAPSANGRAYPGIRREPPYQRRRRWDQNPAFGDRPMDLPLELQRRLDRRWSARFGISEQGSRPDPCAAMIGAKRCNPETASPDGP